MESKNVVHRCGTAEEVDEILSWKYTCECPTSFTVAEILDWPRQKEASRAGNQG